MRRNMKSVSFHLVTEGMFQYAHDDKASGMIYAESVECHEAMRGRCGV